MQDQRVGEKIRPAAKGHYEFHPLQMVVIAFMIASFAVFLYILIAYVATKPTAPIGLSKYFVVSSLLLLLSGQGLKSLMYYFEKEQTRRLITTLSVVIASGLGFLTFQYLGWKDIAVEMMLSPAGALSFLYILVIAHGGMVACALVVTLVSTTSWSIKLQDPINRLVFYTNKYEKLKLSLFGQVWFFLQITWMLIYLTFLLTN
ncbi:MAG: hypothetical protein AAGA85_03005 [Bacteroidota bacterium]